MLHINLVKPAVSSRQDPYEMNRVYPAYTAYNVTLLNQMHVREADMAGAPAYGSTQAAYASPMQPVYRQPVQQPPIPPQPSRQPMQPQATVPVSITPPELMNPILRGQKTRLGLESLGCGAVRICFGWNVSDPRCDIDTSVFLVQENGRVPDDDWFVFYGQPQSPDGSVGIVSPGSGDRQAIRVDVSRLDRRIGKLVFVMTINEAFEQHLNFGMISDAWLRVLDDRTGRELLSYRLEEFSPAVTSMTLGEMYLHRGEWKFNPVGNGVRQDLACQCAIYGVNIG